MLRMKRRNILLSPLQSNMHPQHKVSGPSPCSWPLTLMLEYCHLVTYVTAVPMAGCDITLREIEMHSR